MDNKNQWLKELSNDEKLWAQGLDVIPSMICLSYSQMRNLAQEGQVYGVLLQLKDLYETLYKIPVIMALIVIDSDARYKEIAAYSEVLKASLGAPMSMGQWDALATAIIRMNRDIQLPGSLIEILKRTRVLFSTEVTSDVPDVIKWRNDAIGHGALKFEDDDSYQQEVKSLIEMLKDYFDGSGKLSIKGMYEHAFFDLNGERLIGDNAVIRSDDCELNLHIDSVDYQATNYVDTHNLRCYLFDSFYCRKQLIKYCSITDGQSELKRSKYFSELFEKYVLKTRKDFDIQADFISREEDIILEYLNTPITYIKPTHLVEVFTEKMDEIGHGIIAVFMERGTGKSAFANQMSGLYHKSPLVKNSLSRCYHVQNSALRGIGDFINSVNFGFRHSFDPGQDLWGGNDEMPQLTNETQTPSEDMAKFLNYYHEKYKKAYTILLIDGIDEATEQTQRILDFLPSSDQLDEGVFVVLLSRFKDEETVLGNSKKYIEMAEQISDAKISIHRKDEENVSILKECINRQVSNGEFPASIDCDELIQRADYRFLFLKACLVVKPEILLDNKDERRFVKSYLDHVLSFYSNSQKQKFKETAVSIALFPSISIYKYREYLGINDINYGFVGLLNDLLPVLTVLHVNGDNVFEFADTSYADCVLEAFDDVVSKVLKDFYNSMNSTLGPYFESGPQNRITDQFASLNRLNQAIIFFSEGMIEIWNRALENEMIRKVFWDNYIYLLKMLKQVWCDSWTRSGYGYYLEKELRDCLGAVLLYCLKHSYDETTKEFFDRICYHMNHSTDEKLLRAVQDEFRKAKSYRDICDYMTCNSEEAVIEELFCFFEFDLDDEIIDLLKQRHLVIQYIDYVDGTDADLPSFALRKLSISELSADEEEYLHNIIIKQYIYSKKPVNVMATMARESYEKILQKGYRINKALIPYDGKAIEEKMKASRIVQSAKEELQEVIGKLLDFDAPLRDDNAEMFWVDSLDAKRLGDAYVNDLYSAIYRRMVFEQEHGDLRAFIDVVFQLPNLIEEILQSEFGRGERYYENLLVWIDVFKGGPEGDDGSTIRLLATLLLAGFKWLVDQNRDDEANVLLEELIYYYDLKAFFSKYYWSRQSVSNETPLTNDNPMIYCTQNAVYLLNRYRNTGLIEQFKQLMVKMEQDIPLIDAGQNTDELTRAMCEIEKYKFAQYRKSINYVSEFDKYFDAMIIKHFEVISGILNGLSRDSDFNSLAFHIELLMEYAWRTQQWNLGKKHCDELIEMFEATDCYVDPVIEQSIENQTSTIYMCRNFFMFMNGDPYDKVVDKGVCSSAYYKIVSERENLFYNVLVAAHFEGLEDRGKYLTNDYLKLRPY